MIFGSLSSFIPPVRTCCFPYKTNTLIQNQFPHQISSLSTFFPFCSEQSPLSSPSTRRDVFFVESLSPHHIQAVAKPTIHPLLLMPLLLPLHGALPPLACGSLLTVLSLTRVSFLDQTCSYDLLMGKSWMTPQARSATLSTAVRFFRVGCYPL